MRFRRKREQWGVSYTCMSGDRWTVWIGSRRKTSRIVASLRFVYADAQPVRLSRG